MNKLLLSFIFAASIVSSHAMDRDSSREDKILDQLLQSQFRGADAQNFDSLTLPETLRQEGADFGRSLANSILAQEQQKIREGFALGLASMSSDLETRSQTVASNLWGAFRAQYAAIAPVQFVINPELFIIIKNDAE